MDGSLERLYDEGRERLVLGCCRLQATCTMPLPMLSSTGESSGGDEGNQWPGVLVAVVYWLIWYRLASQSPAASPHLTMAQPSGVHQYKEEKTQKGAMKIEVVMEPQKKPKRDRPGSASSIRNMEDIERRQKVIMSLSCNISMSWSRSQKCNLTHSRLKTLLLLLFSIKQWKKVSTRALSDC